MRTRTFVVVAVLVALVVAGGVSLFASSHPDGLEYVAGQTGFGEKARDSAAAGSPLSDYQVKGVDDTRLSGGLAGVVGALVVLLLAGGLGYAVRRRGSADAEDAGEDPSQDLGQDPSRDASRDPSQDPSQDPSRDAGRHGATRERA